MNSAALHYLDITADICPITFVRTKLALERLQPGELLQVRLKGGEPLKNVPRSASEQGHVVLSVEPSDSGTHTIVIRRGPGA